MIRPQGVLLQQKQHAHRGVIKTATDASNSFTASCMLFDRHILRGENASQD
jgi:hypothetical protein